MDSIQRHAQYLRRTPRDPLEQLRTGRTHPQEVISPVHRRSEYDIVFVEQTERTFEQIRGDVRTVRSDDDRPRRDGVEDASERGPHAGPEVSLTLRHTLEGGTHPSLDIPGALPRSVEDDRAAPVRQESCRVQRPFGQSPIDLRRSMLPDIPSQSGLHRTRLRPFQKDQQRICGGFVSTGRPLTHGESSAFGSSAQGDRRPATDRTARTPATWC